MRKKYDIDVVMIGKPRFIRKTLKETIEELKKKEAKIKRKKKNG